MRVGKGNKLDMISAISPLLAFILGPQALIRLNAATLSLAQAKVE